MFEGNSTFFKVASGLKLNFHKSSIHRINLKNQQVDVFVEVLGCKIGKLPLSYLGLPIGANFRQKGVWKPLVDRFRKKLSGWERRYISFGGSLVLLNFGPICSTYLLPIIF